MPRDYVARNGIEIRLDGVDRVGEILDLTVQAGATSVTGVRFDLKDRPMLERDVLRLPSRTPAARADALAAGRRPNGRSHDPHRRLAAAANAAAAGMMMRAQAADSAQTTIEPGLIEIRAQVTLTVSIK